MDLAAGPYGHVASAHDDHYVVRFLVAAVALAGTALLLHRALEPAPPEVAIGYRAQPAAVLRLAAAEPVLRRRSLSGACGFAAFSCFWVTSAFLLAGAPYRFGQSAIGRFALLGVAGALASKIVGGLADRGHQRAATLVLLGLGVVAFAAMEPGGSSLTWLVVGVLLMDAAVQGAHLMNMSVVYELTRHPRARIASVYMTSYYLGGTAGSVLGLTAYRLGGWPAVPCVGAALLLAAIGCALSRNAGPCKGADARRETVVAGVSGGGVGAEERGRIR